MPLLKHFVPWLIVICISIWTCCLYFTCKWSCCLYLYLSLSLWFLLCLNSFMHSARSWCDIEAFSSVTKQFRAFCFTQRGCQGKRLLYAPALWKYNKIQIHLLYSTGVSRWLRGKYSMMHLMQHSSYLLRYLYFYCICISVGFVFVFFLVYIWSAKVPMWKLFNAWWNTCWNISCKTFICYIAIYNTKEQHYRSVASQTVHTTCNE